MVRQSPHAESILIIDGNASHRRLIAAILEHAGFHVSAVDDAALATDLLQRFTYHAVVRELNLAPAHCEQAVGQLLSMAPVFLRRTVITTTAAARALTIIGPNKVFAVVGKPFDLDELVEAVRRCARGSDDKTNDGDGDAPMQRETVRRFASTVPNLDRSH